MVTVATLDLILAPAPVASISLAPAILAPELDLIMPAKTEFLSLTL